MHGPQSSGESTLGRWGRPLLFLVFGLACLLPGIARETGVTGQDEYWLTLRTPMEMLAGQHFWTPFLNGEPRLRKPPVVYWGIAGLYSTLGIQLWVARLVGVGAALALAALAVALGRRLGCRQPWLAGVLVLCSSGVAIEGRRAMLDLPLAAAVGLTIWTGAWAVGRGASNAGGTGKTGASPLALKAPAPAQLGRGRSVLAGALTGAALALAVLIKGPVALLFAASAALAGLWSFPEARARALRPAAWIAGVLTLLALALPWPISMRLLWPEFAAVMSEEAGARRLSFLPIVSIGPVLGGLFGNCVPWAWALAAGLGLALLRPLGLSPAARFYARWCLLGALPFLFFKSFERYLIPLCLPMAGLIAEQLAANLRPRAQLIIATLLLSLPTLAFGALAWRFAGAWLEPSLAGLALLAAGAYAWGGRATPTAIALCLCLHATLGLVYPRIGINRMPAGFERHAQDRAVFSFEGTQPTMLSMRLGRSVQPLGGQDAQRLSQAFAAPAAIYLDADKLPALTEAAAHYGVTWREVERIPALYARKNWIKFARPDAQRADWLEAWRLGSWAPLASQLVAVLSEPGTAGPASQPTQPASASGPTPAPAPSPDDR